MEFSYKILVFALVLLPLTFLSGTDKNRNERLNEDTITTEERSQKVAAEFYTLNEGEEFREITDIVLNSTLTKEENKVLIRATGRRFFIFTYPSDGYQVKGYLSFVPQSTNSPLLFYVRGGNRLFGLPNPSSDIMCSRNYTVLGTTNRGGVSEGVDEFGGNEVNDIQNLIHYFPVLQQKIGVSFSPAQTFMLGASRGGMQIFLALARSPVLQNQVTKAVSLSGLLDMEETIRDRADMKEMFVKEFGLIPGENEEEWISMRNPMEMVPKIRNDLPFLILQGTDDVRVCLDEGYSMVKKLEENGNPVTYLEIPGGDHCLTNQADRMEIIADWLEQ